MKIERWFFIAATIAAELCARVNGQLPDYHALEEAFDTRADVTCICDSPDAAELWKDGALLAREMAADYA